MDVKKYKKEELFGVAESLNADNIKELVGNLLSKDDKTRYPSLLILQFRSEIENDVYPYWDNFVDMFKSNNSYFRTIGLKLVSINTKWDNEKKIESIIDEYLLFCEDEKLITARLSIQGLHNVINGVKFDRNICDKIVKKLISIDMQKRPDSNLKVMTKDIVNIFIEIEKEIEYKEIVIYLNKCLNDNIIDKDLKARIEELLN